jgi:hypothetical protein
VLIVNEKKVSHSSLPGLQNKGAFLAEIANTCSKENLPFLIGGDFNIMRKPEDKSSGVFDHKWPSLFNAVIESLDLREIVMTGRQYTWAGSGDNPTYEKLDRVLASTEWEAHFPLTRVEARDQNISDHTPLVVSRGTSTHQSGTRPFRFERGWLLREDFYDMVANIWRSEDSRSCPLERCSPRSVGSDNILEGGRLIRLALIKKRKKTLLALLHNIDKKAENDMLTDQEINLKHHLKEHLVSLLREEELKWYERAKVKTLLEGDANTRFFTLWLMARIGNNILIDLKVTKALLLALTISKDTLLIITKICLGPQIRRRSL